MTGLGEAGHQQSAAELEFVCTVATGEEAELADAYQASRQHVEQEAAQELDRVECHELSTGVVRVIFPLKTDLAVFERADAVIGDGHAVGVASQILEHAVRSAKGRFDVDHPIDGGGLITQSLEGGGIGESFQFAAEMQSALSKRAAEGSEEGFPEAMAEQAHREKEGRFPAADPA